jgi:hypothetical protein
MSNKSKRKNTRQVAKQKRRRTPSNLSLAVPSQPLPPDFKISAAILHLAEPLRTLYREPHRLQAIIAITVMAWNIALFPEDEQPHVQGMLLESLPPQMGGEDVGVFLSTIDTLIARKHLLYPHVREYILKHDLSFVNDRVTLTVGTAPVPATIRRRSS